MRLSVKNLQFVQRNRCVFLLKYFITTVCNILIAVSIRSNRSYNDVSRKYGNSLPLQKGRTGCSGTVDSEYLCRSAERFAGRFQQGRRDFTFFRSETSASRVVNPEGWFGNCRAKKLGLCCTNEERSDFSCSSVRNKLG